MYFFGHHIGHIVANARMSSLGKAIKRYIYEQQPSGTVSLQCRLLRFQNLGRCVHQAAAAEASSGAPAAAAAHELLQGRLQAAAQPPHQHRCLWGNLTVALTAPRGVIGQGCRTQLQPADRSSFVRPKASQLMRCCSESQCKMKGPLSTGLSSSPIRDSCALPSAQLVPNELNGRAANSF